MGLRTRRAGAPQGTPASEKRRGDVAPADMVRRIVHCGHPPGRHVEARDGEWIEPVGARDDRRARCRGRMTARAGEGPLEATAVEIRRSVWRTACRGRLM